MEGLWLSPGRAEEETYRTVVMVRSKLPVGEFRKPDVEKSFEGIP